MTTHRRYLFQHPGRWTDRYAYGIIQRVLEHGCQEHWWYDEPVVEGQPVQLLMFSFTVRARDQWFAHKRALRLATDCYYALGMDEKQVPVPDWEALAPHANRGYSRTSAAT